MKKNNTLPQLLIILLSALILIAAVFFAFSYTAAKVGNADIFNSDSVAELDDITTPVSYETHIAKGDSLMKSGSYNTAATEYALAITIKDTKPDAYVKLGDAYLAMNDNSSAIEQYVSAVNLAPNSAEYNTKYALALMRNDQLDEASDVFANISDQNETVLYYSGILDSLLGNYDSAKDKFSKTGSQDFISAYSKFDGQTEGQDIYLRALLTEALIKDKEFAIAANMARDILSEKSDYRDVWILLGYAKLKLEQYQEAQDAFKQAETVDSVKPETHYFLGMTYYMQELYEEAVKEFELAVLYDFSPSSEVYRKIAECQIFLQNYDAALEAYEYLIKIDHESVESFIRPVWLAINELNDLDRALTLAQESVTYFPNEAMSHNLLAWVQIERGDLDDASKSLNNAFKIDPNLPAAHYNLGLLKEKAGDIDAAKDAYMDAYKLAPSGDTIGNMAAEKYNSLITN